MTTLAYILKELFGLFVDDGSLAIAILALVALVAVLLHFGLFTPLVGGGLLVLGLAALMLENLLRAVRRLDRAR